MPNLFSWKNKHKPEDEQETYTERLEREEAIREAFEKEHGTQDNYKDGFTRNNKHYQNRRGTDWG